MPGWMAALQKKFSKHETHINIQLFIAKLIVNEAKVRTLLENKQISRWNLDHEI